MCKWKCKLIGSKVLDHLKRLLLGIPDLLSICFLFLERFVCRVEGIWFIFLLFFLTVLLFSVIIFVFWKFIHVNDFIDWLHGRRLLVFFGNLRAMITIWCKLDSLCLLVILTSFLIDSLHLFPLPFLFQPFLLNSFLIELLISLFISLKFLLNSFIVIINGLCFFLNNLSFFLQNYV